MKLSILVDNRESWFFPYAVVLTQDLRAANHTVALVHNSADLAEGDCAFFLSCEKLVKPETLAKHKHNLVLHSSALPAGKGWSPLTYLILEGKDEIPMTLFEATEAVDSGNIYLQDTIHFAGHELNPELKEIQGKKIIEMIKQFMNHYPNITARPQASHGESFYPRRRSADSELDPTKTLAEQFALLRVVDNERYPAFFHYRGHKYIIKIYKADDAKGGKNNLH